MEILTPAPLKHGDRVAIVAPSGIIKPQTVHDAVPVIVGQGWTTYVGEHTFDRRGTYAGSDDDRYSDLESALLCHTRHNMRPRRIRSSTSA